MSASTTSAHTLWPNPTGRVRSSHYTYDLIDPGEPFTPIPGGKVVCSIPTTVIPAGEQRIATRIWLALRTSRPTDTTELLDGPYASNARPR